MKGCHVGLLECPHVVWIRLPLQGLNRFESLQLIRYKHWLSSSAVFASNSMQLKDSDVRLEEDGYCDSDERKFWNG